MAWIERGNGERVLYRRIAMLVASGEALTLSDSDRAMLLATVYRGFLSLHSLETNIRNASEALLYAHIEEPDVDSETIRIAIVDGLKNLDDERLICFAISPRALNRIREAHEA